MKYYLIPFCLLVLFSSCNSQKFIFKNEKINIEVEIQETKKIELNTYKIKGSVTVSNLTDNVLLFDLNKIQLKPNYEYKIYIDSIASRLIEVQEIKPYEIYNINVYWIVHSKKELVIYEIEYKF